MSAAGVIGRRGLGASLFQTVLPSVWVQFDRAPAVVAGRDWTRHALRDSLSQAFETPVSSKCPTVVHLLQRLVFFCGHGPRRRRWRRTSICEQAVCERRPLRSDQGNYRCIRWHYPAGGSTPSLSSASDGTCWPEARPPPNPPPERGRALATSNPDFPDDPRRS